MLNTLKVIQELERTIPTLFSEMRYEHNNAYELFTWLQKHPDEVDTLKTLQGPYSLPLWQGPLDYTKQIERQEHPYAVLAVDGSQIYPDKHQGVPCYVLNSGVAQFVYGEEDADVSLISSPQIVTQIDDTHISEDMVNCRREEREFEVGLHFSREIQKSHPTMPFVFLCDGSLIFWHLESKSQALKERFFKRYLEQLDDFYSYQVPIAGYISLPKSKDLVALLKTYTLHKNYPSVEGSSFDTLVDTALVSIFLKNGQSTTIFTHNSSLALQYPDHLRPCFVYLDTGYEIARVEVPYWIGQKEDLFESLLRIILDQSVKGNGYPVSLAEAHEQAVIKGREREFFFRLLQNMTVQHDFQIQVSQKSLKKRFVSI